MRVKFLLSIGLLVAVAATSFANSDKEWTLNFDAQSVWMSKNQISVPNGATRFSFRDLTGTGSKSAFRGELVYRPGGKATEWRLLVAPLSYSGSGTLAAPVSFQGQVFASSTTTQGTYKFNSYRLTWRREFSPGWSFGATLKVRDARIALKQGATTASESNVGLVPLLHLSGRRELGGGFTANLDIDAAWAKQGRAVDLGLALGYKVNPDVEIRLAARVLEGGADVPKVYNFSQFNYLSFGTSVRF